MGDINNCTSYVEKSHSGFSIVLKVGQEEEIFECRYSSWKGIMLAPTFLMKVRQLVVEGIVLTL